MPKSHLGPSGSAGQDPSLRSGGLAAAARPTRLPLPRWARPPPTPRREATAEATDAERGQAPGTASKRTRFPTRGAGKAESTEIPGISGGREQTRSPPLLVPTRFMTLLPMLALLPVSVSPKEAVGPTSLPSPVSKGDPNSGPGEGASGGWQPAGVSLPPHLGMSVAGQPIWIEMGPPTPRPGQGGPAGATAAQDERSSPVVAEGSEAPPTEPPRPGRRVGSPAAQEGTGAHAEIGGTLLVSTWWPATDATEPSLAWSLARSASSGQGRDVAAVTAEPAQPPTPVPSSGPRVTGDEVPPEELGATEASVGPARMSGPLPQREAPEPWTAVGSFRPDTAMPPPPRSSKDPSRSVAPTRKAVLQDHSAGSTVASSVPSTMDEAPTSSSSAAPPAGRKEEAPSSPPREAGPSSNISHPAVSLGVEPSAGTQTPGPGPLPSATSLAWLSPDSPEGAVWRPRGEKGPSLASSDAALTPAEVSPEGPFPTEGDEGDILQVPSEPFSISSAKAGDLAQLTSQPAHLLPSWLTKGVPLAAMVPHPTEASTGPAAPTDSTRSSRGFPTPPAKQAATAGTPGWAGEGARGGTPTSRTPRKVGEGAGQTPTPTKWPAGSPAAWHPREGGVASSSSSQGPEQLSTVAAFSSPAPESATAPTRQRGGTAAPDSPSSAASQSREWGPRPGGPGTEVAPPSLHRPGPSQAASAERPGGSRHVRPPTPAPGPGSIPREEPPGAWLWASAAEEEEEGAATTVIPPGGEGRPRAHPLFVAENQPPLLKAAFLHIPCELVLAMEFSRSFRNPESPEYRRLVLSINETVTSLLAPLPGFQRLEVKTIRPGSVVVEFDALFLARAPGLWAALNRSSLSERLPPGLWVANASVLRSMTRERHLDLCSVLFSCRAGYECVAEEGAGRAICTSLCHRDYCKNQGICTHAANHTPVCQCPVGSDFWFLGVRCDYKVTQQGVLGAACGLLLSLVVVGGAVAGLVVRRVRLLLLEARADQTKSSYRRFCRLDDVSAHYWSEPWLASASSLDNPAFSNSEELLHLQILDAGCYGCREESPGPDGFCKRSHGTPRVGGVRRPSSRHRWDERSGSPNDPMIDSGKASEVSVSSWPMEPIQWSPFPGLHQPPREQAQKAPRPLSCCEGTELVNLERSWTA